MEAPGRDGDDGLVGRAARIPDMMQRDGIIGRPTAASRVKY
jgi:hypothetical protein